MLRSVIVAHCDWLEDLSKLRLNWGPRSADAVSESVRGAPVGEKTPSSSTDNFVFILSWEGELRTPHCRTSEIPSEAKYIDSRRPPASKRDAHVAMSCQNLSSRGV